MRMLAHCAASFPSSPNTARIANMTRGLGGHSPSNIMAHLKGTDFPAKKQDLVKKAKENSAGQDILEIIANLPEETYNTAADVMKAFGEEEREHAKEQQHAKR